MCRLAQHSVADLGMRLDAIDRALLDTLQVDGRISWRELGETVGLSAPAVRDRVKAMERAGVITGYGAQVDPEQLGLAIRAIIRLTSSDGAADATLAELDEVVECHRVTGSESHVVRALLRSTGHLEEVLSKLWDRHGAQTVTNIVTSTPVPRRPPSARALMLND